MLTSVLAVQSHLLASPSLVVEYSVQVVNWIREQTQLISHNLSCGCVLLLQMFVSAWREMRGAGRETCTWNWEVLPLSISIAVWNRQWICKASQWEDVLCAGCRSSQSLAECLCRWLHIHLSNAVLPRCWSSTYPVSGCGSRHHIFCRFRQIQSFSVGKYWQFNVSRKNVCFSLSFWGESCEEFFRFKNCSMFVSQKFLPMVGCLKH